MRGEERRQWANPRAWRAVGGDAGDAWDTESCSAEQSVARAAVTSASERQEATDEGKRVTASFEGLEIRSRAQSLLGM